MGNLLSRDTHFKARRRFLRENARVAEEERRVKHNAICDGMLERLGIRPDRIQNPLAIWNGKPLYHLADMNEYYGPMEPVLKSSEESDTINYDRAAEMKLQMDHPSSSQLSTEVQSSASKLGMEDGMKNRSGNATPSSRKKHRAVSFKLTGSVSTSDHRASIRQTRVKNVSFQLRDREHSASIINDTAMTRMDSADHSSSDSVLVLPSEVSEQEVTTLFSPSDAKPKVEVTYSPRFRGRKTCGVRGSHPSEVDVVFPPQFKPTDRPLSALEPKLEDTESVQLDCGLQATDLPSPDTMPTFKVAELPSSATMGELDVDVSSGLIPVLSETMQKLEIHPLPETEIMGNFALPRALSKVESIPIRFETVSKLEAVEPPQGDTNQNFPSSKPPDRETWQNFNIADLPQSETRQNLEPFCWERRQDVTATESSHCLTLQNSIATGPRQLSSEPSFNSTENLDSFRWERRLDVTATESSHCLTPPNSIVTIPRQLSSEPSINATEMPSMRPRKNRGITETSGRKMMQNALFTYPHSVISQKLRGTGPSIFKKKRKVKRTNPGFDDYIRLALVQQTEPKRFKITLPRSDIRKKLGTSGPQRKR